MSVEALPQKDAAWAPPEFLRTRGMKDAEGLHVLDPRTVQFLVHKGVGTQEQVQKLLRRKDSQRQLFHFQEAVASYSFLERILGDATKMRYGVLVPLARSVVQRYPMVLRHTLELLEAKWQALLAPRPQGAGLTEKQAVRTISFRPGMLGNSVFSIATRRQWLEAQGVIDSSTALSKFPEIAGLSLATLEEKVQVLRDCGLDTQLVLTGLPSCMGISAARMRSKLELLLDVLQLSKDTVSKSAVLLGLNVERRMRQRILLLAQLNGGVMPRFLLTRVRESEAEFLKHLLKRKGLPAHLRTQAAIKAHVSSPEYVAYADRALAEQLAVGRSRRAALNRAQKEGRSQHTDVELL